MAQNDIFHGEQMGDWVTLGNQVYKIADRSWKASITRKKKKKGYHSQVWKMPEQGRIKINSDAMYMNEIATTVWITQDNIGTIFVLGLVYFIPQTPLWQKLYRHLNSQRQKDSDLLWLQ